MSAVATVIQAYILLITVLFSSLGGLRTFRPEKYYSEYEISAFTEAAREAGADGMIIAIGGGFDNDDNFGLLLERAISHTGKESPNMLFIPSGHRDELDEVEVIPERFAAAGCDTDILLVSKESAEAAAQKIEWADIIYETGGSLKFLTENWGEKGVFEMMRSAFARGKVLMGVSTGAMCWAERGWDDTEEPVLRVTAGFPFVGKASGYKYYEASGIIPFCVVPHFDSFGWKVYAAEAEKLDIPSLCIENGAAVVYTGGEYEVVVDPLTPLRTAYLFVPERGISFCNLRKSPVIAAVADGERRAG